MARKQNERQRLAMKSRGTLEKRENALKGDVKKLMQEWKDVKEVMQDKEVAGKYQDLDADSD